MAKTERAGIRKLQVSASGACRPYVADFLCREAMLIVEIDGSQQLAQVEYDQYRDAFLRASGYEVVRFWNNEVLMNVNGVLESLNLTLSPKSKEVEGRRSPKGRGN